MKHKKNTSTSIHIYDSIWVSSNRSGKKLWWFWILEGLIVFTGAVSVIYGFVTALSLPLYHRTFLLGGLLLTLLLMGLCEGGKISRYAWPVSFILAVYIIWKSVDVIVNGFFYIENAILAQLNQYFGLQLYLYVTKGEQRLCVTYFLLVVFALLSLMLSLVVWKRCSRFAYLFLALAVYGSILLLGIVPSWRPLLLTLLVAYLVESMDYIPVSMHKFNRKNKQAKIGAEGKKQVVRIKSALITGAITILSMLLGYSILTPDQYENINIKEHKHKLQSFLNDFSYEDTMEMLRNKFGEIPFFKEKEKISGGLNSGKIDQAAEVVFSKETALRLTLRQDFNWCYLKGYAGVSYGEDHWGDLTKKEQERYQNLQEKYQGRFNGEDLTSQFLTEILDSKIVYNDQSVLLMNAALNLQADLQSMEIEHVNANDSFYYAPYFVQHSLMEGLSLVGDQYFRPVNSQNNYKIFNIYRLPEYYDLNSIALDLSYMAERLGGYIQNYDQSLWSYEKEYREFVNDVYTQLPGDGLSRLRKLVFESDETGNVRKLEMISSVVSYLNRYTQYSLSPGLVPKGKDYVEYFLFDNQIGYCAHYASSAVLMLRNNGVPARYVEGYIVTGEDINHGVFGEASLKGDRKKIVEIKDTNAHAWIEVYFDGIGWLPVEVTKGYSNSGISEILPEVKEEKLTPTATKAPTKTPAITPTGTIAATPTITIAPKPTTSVSIPPKQGEEGEVTQTSKQELPGYVSLVLWTMAIIVLIALLFYLRYRLIWFYRSEKLRKGTSQHRVLACYQEIEAILDYLGYEKQNVTSYQDYAAKIETLCPLLPKGYEQVALIALRARFSKLEITEEELSFVSLFYRNTRVRIFKEKNAIKRFFLKYWKCL